MLKIIHYDWLTWPEVFDLPRDIPFVLRLGEGSILDEVAKHIGSETICLLPSLPYGWQTSVPRLVRQCFKE